MITPSSNTQSNAQGSFGAVLQQARKNKQVTLEQKYPTLKQSEKLPTFHLKEISLPPNIQMKAFPSLIQIILFVLQCQPTIMVIRSLISLDIR